MAYVVKLTHDQRRERRLKIVAAVAAGRNAGEVAREFGVSIQTVYAAMVEGSVSLNRVRRQPRRPDIADYLRATGATYVAAAARFGVGLSLVVRAARDGGVQRTRGARAKPEEQKLLKFRGLDWGKRNCDLAADAGVSDERIRQVRIALGMAKRDCKVGPEHEAVFRYIRDNATSLRGLTFREIKKRLPGPCGDDRLRNYLHLFAVSVEREPSVAASLTKDNLKSFCHLTDSGCWEWPKRHRVTGYGIVYQRVNRYLHRLSYTLFNGEPPSGMQVLHHCDNPPCCNPSHLFLGTASENMADRNAKGRTRPGSALTTDQVQDIRRRCRNGERDLYMMGKDYGVSGGTIWRAVRRRTYKGVPDVAEEQVA